MSPQGRTNIAMSIVAELFDFVVGVDTHARTHTLTHSGADTPAPTPLPARMLR